MSAGKDLQKASSFGGTGETRFQSARLPCGILLRLIVLARNRQERLHLQRVAQNAQKLSKEFSWVLIYLGFVSERTLSNGEDFLKF